jgi:hypothetical protein
MNLDGSPEETIREMLAKDLQHIESVFLTTKGVGDPVC